VVLAIVSVVALLLTGGCGSLTRAVNETPQPVSSEPKELTNIHGLEDRYNEIELFSATSQSPHYSPDEKGYIYQADGWIYLHIEGDPESRGYQHGWLLAGTIQEALDSNITMLRALYGVDWAFLKTKALEMWADSISPEYKAELQAIVQGANERKATFDYGDLLVFNGLEELRDYWLPEHISDYYISLSPDAGLSLPNTADTTALGESTYARQVDTVQARKQGSAFIATGSATSDGSIVLAHNTIASYVDMTYANVIIDLVPDSGQHIVMQAQPGYIHSVAELYSSDSLVITQTNIGSHTGYVEGGIPEFNRARQAVQYSATLDEFTAALLTGNNGAVASSWLVGQLDTKEIMELELGLKFYNVQKSTDGSFVNSNLVDDRRILEFEMAGSNTVDIRRGSAARQVRLLQLAKQYRGTIDAEVAKTIIADNFDVYLSKSKASSRTVCAHYELDNAEYSGTDVSIVPYEPYGSSDGAVLTSQLASEHTILVRWGTACGKPFDSAAFLQQNRQFDYLREYLYDRPSNPWTSLAPVVAQ
jgi:hypothetical protein